MTPDTARPQDQPDPPAFAATVTLAVEDVRALLALLLYVPDAVLRQRDHDALLRRVGIAMGRPL